MNEATKLQGPAPQAIENEASEDAQAPSTPPTLPPRLRRTVELVFRVEGVTAARVWHWPGHVAVGVRPAMMAAPAELLRRVEHAVAGLREPDETWDFGLLETAD